MLKLKDILDEKDKRLRIVSKEVEMPLSSSEKKLVNEAIEYLTNSQIEQMALEYNLRPGMGLAAPQLGVNKRFFVVVEEIEDQKFKNYILVNPKIVSHSEELIYSGYGEGCLSVNREVKGIVPRFARVTIEGFDENGNHVKYRAREELAIAFQHEIDHLNGILFTDKINPKNPYKDADKMREI